MKRIREFDTVVLHRALPNFGLEAGDIGTVVHCYDDGEGLEVEFVTGSGDTVAVATVERADIRPSDPRATTDFHEGLISVQDTDPLRRKP